MRRIYAAQALTIGPNLMCASMRHGTHSLPRNFPVISGLAAEKHRSHRRGSSRHMRARDLSGWAISTKATTFSLGARRAALLPKCINGSASALASIAACRCRWYPRLARSTWPLVLAWQCMRHSGSMRLASGGEQSKCDAHDRQSWSIEVSSVRRVRVQTLRAFHTGAVFFWWCLCRVLAAWRGAPAHVNVYSTEKGSGERPAWVPGVEASNARCQLPGVSEPRANAAPPLSRAAWCHALATTDRAHAGSCCAVEAASPRRPTEQQRLASVFQRRHSDAGTMALLYNFCFSDNIRYVWLECLLWQAHAHWPKPIPKLKQTGQWAFCTLVRAPPYLGSDRSFSSGSSSGSCAPWSGTWPMAANLARRASFTSIVFCMKSRPTMPTT